MYIYVKKYILKDSYEKCLKELPFFNLIKDFHTAGFMKTFFLVYTHLMNAIYLSIYPTVHR